MKKYKIAIVEDNRMFANITAEFIANEMEAEVLVFNDANSFLESDLQSFDLVLLDYYLNIQDFFAPTGELILDKLGKLNIRIPIILLSDVQKPSKVIELMGKGVLDFIPKSETLFISLLKAIKSLKEIEEESNHEVVLSNASKALSKRVAIRTVLLLVILLIL